MAGPAGIQYPLVVRFTQSAAGITNNDYVATRPGRVVEMWAASTAGGGGETMRLSRVRAGAPAVISDAMTFLGANAVVRAATLDDATYDLVAGDSFRFAAAGAATVNADVFVLFLATPVAGSVTLTDA